MIKIKQIQIGDTVHNQYKILEKFDSKQHSSKIYKGIDSISGKIVVIKITSALHGAKIKIVTKILQKLRGGIGIPNILWRGIHGTQTITVTECLGPNLKKLFLLMEKKFTLATIAMIAIQLLNTLENIHKHNYVCCNIMPKEILISLKKKNTSLYITDFKQAKKVSSEKLNHSNHDTHSLSNKYILNKFSSVNLHLGMSNHFCLIKPIFCIDIAPSPKDDLESLGYILIYFLKEGNLFERTIKASNKDEKLKFYEQQKLAIVPETFCATSPNEIVCYLSYVKSLQASHIHDKIDYDYMRKLFKSLFIKSFNINSNNEFQYDWIKRAIVFHSDTQYKLLERGNLDNSFAVLDTGSITLRTVTNRDFQEEIGPFIGNRNEINFDIPKNMTDIISNNNNNKFVRNESYSPSPTDSPTAKYRFNLSPNDSMSIYTVGADQDLKYIKNKKLMFTTHENQIAEENSSPNGSFTDDNIATDIFENVDTDDNKFDYFNIHAKEQSI